ncbi:MAG TPA: hypothetical protein VHG35_11090 [Gemmatimonadales bacterium]|nr:hypothetical protein [Gemmatimonadales bacterium]
MTRLLVLACSARKHRTPSPVPAWYRYDGVLFRLCKRLQAERRFPSDVRIRILSAEHGVLTPDTPIAWYDRRLDAARAAELRESVTRALCVAVKEEEEAREVYLALGGTYRAAVGPLPAHVRVRGAPAGIGMMQSRLRRWLAVPAAGAGQLRLEFSRTPTPSAGTDPQLALALPAPRAGASRLPGTWPKTLFYASGTNDAGEIRGFAALGIPVGFCAAHVGPSALAELDRLHATGAPVFGDTGAYGEVSAPAGPEATERLAVVRPITGEEWEARLAVYDRVAARFGARFDAVAPDRVGDQEVTLERLLAFRFRIRALAARGARILLPLHRGARPLPGFFAEARRLLGIDLVPAFPMPKGGTTARDMLSFVASVRPPRIHLLGLGLRGRRARDLLPLLALGAPGIRVSMDANLITSAVGRRADGSPARRLTAAQDAIRRRLLPRAFADVVDRAWGIHADYTDSVSLPSGWLGPTGLRRVAAAAGLSPSQSHRWRRDPDAFLQEPVSGGSDSILWWEHPLMELALGEAWLQHLHRLHTAPRKERAIRMVFKDHPAAGQFPLFAPRAALPRAA